MRSQRWFQRRRVGLGWRPADWHGWLITLLAAAGVLAVLRSSPRVVRADPGHDPDRCRLRRRRTRDRRHQSCRDRCYGRSARARASPRSTSASSSSGRRSRRSARGGRRRARRDEPALVVEHLTKRFGERVAVDDVSFSVGAGEVFGFLGPNGAGKTTTVRMLATLIAPTSGTARVAGLPLDAANGVAIRTRIAVMTENPGLYLRLTRGREPRVLRRPVRARRAEGADRAGVGGGQPRRPGERSLRQPLEGAPPTRRARTCVAQRSGDPLPRRADLGSRSGRITRGARTDRRPPRAGRHRLSHDPPARGSRASLRSRRHPEHQAAHDRPAGRAPRPALHQDARRAHRGAARLAGCRFRGRRASMAGVPTTRPATC